MSETILKLEFPFPDGQGNTITELKIRRPKVRDIRKMTGKTETEMAVSLLAIVTGLVPEDIDELDMADYAKLQTAFKEMVKGKSA